MGGANGASLLLAGSDLPRLYVLRYLNYLSEKY